MTSTLLEAAAHGDGHLKHTLSRAKQDRTAARTIAAGRAALTEAGVTVIDRPAPDSPAVWVERLHHDGKPLDVESHQACPGHAFYLATELWRDRPSTVLSTLALGYQETVYGRSVTVASVLASNPTATVSFGYGTPAGLTARPPRPVSPCLPVCSAPGRPSRRAQRPRHPPRRGPPPAHRTWTSSAGWSPPPR